MIIVRKAKEIGRMREHSGCQRMTNKDYQVLDPSNELETLLVC